MKRTEFREIAHQLVDWMADFLDDVDEKTIVPDVTPGDIRNALPSSAPLQAECFSSIFRDFQEIIMPGMTLWNHPGWFAYFPANHSPASICAEMLTATIGAQCMSWQTSPAATELEQVVLGWLQEMLSLPSSFTGSIQDTASSSTLVSLLSAREKLSSHGVGAEGAISVESRWIVYASKEAHSSIDKAVKLAGFGLKNLRSIETDDSFAMKPDALEEAIKKDLALGYTPACVIATVGTTSSGAVDPVAVLGALCEKYGLWFHVDAAYAGSAALLEEKAWVLDGVEYADSFVFNPHKWLLTNFDCSAYYVQDVPLLLRTFRSNPEYLKTVYDPEVVNFRDWGIPLGRRFRALKLWFVLRGHGVEGLQELLRSHIAWAQMFSSWVDAHSSFERMAPVYFGLVCFRHRPEGCDDEAVLEAHNQALLTQINQTGRFFLTHTKLDGKYVLRVVVGQLYTKEEHVKDVWSTLCSIAEKM